MRNKRNFGRLPVIAVLLALFMFQGWGGAAGAVTQAQIDAMQASVDQIGDQIKELEGKLSGIQSDKTQALQQKQYLDEQMALINRQIAETDAILNDYQVLITAKQSEIEELQAKETAQYELFCKRVRAMEEQGSVSYLSILFDSASFSDLLDNAMLMSEIMDYDNEIIDLLEATRAELEAAKTELESEQAQQQLLKDAQTANRANLQVQQAKAAELVSQILAQESEYKTALAEIEAEEERVQAEVVRLSKALAEQQSAQGQGGSAALGGYAWPVSSRRITSPYGGRNTGIPGASTNHKGVDIGGVGYTSKVSAAKAGTVIVSRYSSSYGNYVVVSHGSGNTTLYAHMSSRSVSVGDVVAQGDTLGITGDTGVSRGAHLHFEITENGARVDPLNYLTGYVQAW